MHSFACLYFEYISCFPVEFVDFLVWSAIATGCTGSISIPDSAHHYPAFGRVIIPLRGGRESFKFPHTRCVEKNPRIGLFSDIGASIKF